MIDAHTLKAGDNIVYVSKIFPEFGMVKDGTLHFLPSRIITGF
jgi:hypothetical protein